MAFKTKYKDQDFKEPVKRPNESVESYVYRRVCSGVSKWKIRQEVKKLFNDYDFTGWEQLISVSKEQLKDKIEIYNKDPKNFVIGILLGELESEFIKTESRLKVLEQLAKISELYSEKKEIKLDSSNFGFEFGG